MAVVLLRRMGGRAHAAAIVGAVGGAAPTAAPSAASASKGVDQMAAKAVDVSVETGGGKETLDFIVPVLLPLHLRRAVAAALSS